MRIVYFDKFEKHNSNIFWAEAFATIGETVKVDVREDYGNLQMIEADHIHFGGSVKQMIEPMTWWPGVPKTVFNGDGFNFQEFFAEIEPLMSGIFCTNKSASRGSKYHFLFCPAPDFYIDGEWIEDKKYNVVFVGNNYDKNRKAQLNVIREVIDLTLFGGVEVGSGLQYGWETGVGPINYAEYKAVVQNSWITLGDPAGPICRHSCHKKCILGLPYYTKGLCRERICGRFDGLDSYLSNRLANCLLPGSVHVVPWVKGLEDYFVNWTHLVWYNSMEEGIDFIQQLLNDRKLCRTIAFAGQKRARELGMTFSEAARRILNV